MQIVSWVVEMPALLNAALPSDEMIQAQLKAGAVGGALLGTLIGVGVGLMWLLLTRKKSSRKEKKKEAKKAKVEAQKAQKAQQKVQEKPVKQKAVKQVKVSQPQKEVVPQVKVSQPKVKEGPVVLKLKDSEAPNNVLEVVVEDHIIVGRNPERCTLVLNGDDTVSGVHCKIYETHGKLTLTDLASTNGTFINNVRVDKSVTLQPGDSVKIGTRQYTVNY